MGISTTAAKKPIRSPRFPEGLSPWRALVERTLDQLCRASGHAIQIDGAQSGSTGADGTQQFRIPSGSGGNDASALFVRTNGSVVPSTIGGVMPTIGGTALDAGTPPTLSLSGSGTEYVIATISGTVIKTTLSGRDFFHPMTDITVALSVTTTAITSGDSFKDASPFKLLLATFVDGVKTAQIGRGPISLTWNDDLTGAGSAQMVATWTA